MQQIETFKNLVKPLVMAGIYKDSTSALKAVIIDYIERKRMEYDTVIDSFRQKYQNNFEEFSRDIVDTASIENEDDWMEWKGALEIRRSWDEAYRLSIHDEGV
ncbi:MAG: hypothetical protein GY765_24025 [bacterium]|nr:hypothetical protein [bacterium]